MTTRRGRVWAALLVTLGACGPTQSARLRRPQPNRRWRALLRPPQPRRPRPSRRQRSRSSARNLFHWAAARLRAILNDMAGEGGLAATVMSADGTWSGAAGKADGRRDLRVDDPVRHRQRYEVGSRSPR